jgi:hypothetical protein
MEIVSFLAKSFNTKESIARTSIIVISICISILAAGQVAYYLGTLACKP